MELVGSKTVRRHCSILSLGRFLSDEFTPTEHLSMCSYFIICFPWNILKTLHMLELKILFHQTFQPHFPPRFWSTLLSFGSCWCPTRCPFVCHVKGSPFSHPLAHSGGENGWSSCQALASQKTEQWLLWGFSNQGSPQKLLSSFSLNTLKQLFPKLELTQQCSCNDCHIKQGCRLVNNWPVALGGRWTRPENLG